MSSDLTTKKCQSCAKNTSPFSFEEAKTYLTQIPDWSLSPDGKSISRELVMKDFLAAIRLMNQIAEVAEAEDHHPEGGIGDAVREVVSEKGIKVYSLAVTKKPHSASSSEQLSYQELDSKGIVKRVKEILS